MSAHDNGVPETDAVRGIRRKIAHAQEQLEFLEVDIQRFWDRQSIVLVGDFDPASLKVTVRLRIIEPMPVEWPIIFGEVVHNLRSALDHCVYQLTISHSGKPLKMSGFPILLDKAAFFMCGKSNGLSERSGLYQIRGVSPVAQTFIEGLQPYNHGDRKSVLWNLHRAWNQDKHRLINLMAAVPKSASVTVDPPVDHALKMFAGPKEDGAVVAEVTFVPGGPIVEVGGEITFQVVDKDGWDTDSPATVTYETLLGEVSLTVGKLLLML